MSGTRTFVYITFFSKREMFEAASVEEAKAFLLQRYPHAHFGQWQQAPRNLNVGVWENGAVRLRFELGEKEDKHRPVA